VNNLSRERWNLFTEVKITVSLISFSGKNGNNIGHTGPVIKAVIKERRKTSVAVLEIVEKTLH